VAHGNLSVVINTEPVISQPGAFSGGNTVVAQTSQIELNQGGGALQMVKGGASLADVVKGLNSPGRQSAGPGVDPAGHEGRRRAARRTRDHLRT
jgi:flagellar basal body P-ring protein FlgI